MASKIRIFRSTGATAPSSLEYGELAVTVEQGTAGTSANKAGRLFVGNASGNPVEIGGEYTYKLMDHPHGELINSSVAIVDSNGQINGWSVAGILTATRASITDINVSGASTVGVLTVTNDVNIGGALYIQGNQVLAEGGSSTFSNLKVTGITTLGDAATDVIDINGRTDFATDVTFDTNIIVAGISTFTGAIDGNGGANISGGETVLSSATVSDLTDNRVVFAGTGGILEDNLNFTYDGNDLSVNSAKITDLTSGRVVLAGTGGAVEDSGNLTFGAPGLVVGAGGLNVTGVSTFNNNVDFSGTIDVDGQAIFDDVTVSAAATFTGAVDMNGGLDVSGGETVLSSATVSDLTSGRVVLAGASGALEDSGNLTFGAPGLVVGAGGLNVTGVSTFNNNVDFAGTIDVDGQAIFDDITVSAAATVSGATQLIGTLTLGSGGTKYTLPTADGSANQVLTTNGSGVVSFQESSSTLVISAGAATTDPVNLLTDVLTVAATNNETKTTLTDNTITVGLATDIVVGGE